MTDLKQYIKIAYRNICKRKGQSIIGVIGLSMSIMAFTFCLFLLEYIAILNYKIPNYENIVEIEGYTETGKYSNSSWKKNLASKILELNIDGIEHIGLVALENRQEVVYFQTKEDQETPYTINSNYVSEGILNIFSIRLKTGLPGDIFKQEGKIILAESTAEKIYGDTSPVGYTIRIHDQLYTIAGIMEDIPFPNSISGLPIDFLISISNENIPEKYSYEAYYTIHALIKNKKLLPHINKQLQNSGITYEEGIPQIKSKKIGIIDDEGKIIPIVLVWFCIGYSVLLIGIINFLSINISTFYNRTKELVLRKISGSTVGDLFKLLFTELTILMILVFFLTITLTEGLLPFILNDLIFSQLNVSFPFIIPTGLLIRAQCWYFLYILLFCGLIACSRLSDYKKFQRCRD